MPDNKTTGGSVLGMVPGIVGGAIQVGQALGIGRKARERRQVEQQGKLNDQQIRGQKELADYQQKLGLEMWDKTNYEAQVRELKEAGLNPALLYGKGGGGGTTAGMGMATGVSGGQAATAVQQQQASQGATQGLAMLPAQIELIKAQTENVKADTENKAGVDRELKGAQAGESGARKASVEFQNELNKTIGIDDMVNRYKWASEKLETESQKVNAEYEAWKAGNFAGTTFDDPNSPMAKAIKAGLDQTIEQLKKTKLENNAQAATNVVKQFEARLAEQGIHPHSPWWTKLVTDMLEKVGLTDMIGLGQKEVKQQIKQ